MLAIGDRPITWYALLFVAGLLGGYLIALASFRRDRVDVTYLNILLVFIAIGAVVGARLGEVVFYEWPYYRAHPADIVKIWRGGLASHGAVVGITLMLWLYARVVVRAPLLWVADHAVPGIAFAAACVRLGNLINSEILGTPTSVPWAFVFPRVDATPRHPVQIYEGVLYVALAIVLVALSRRRPLPRGCLSGIFLAGMFAPRFVIEFVKDGAIVALGMKTGQVLSVPLAIAGIAMYVVCARRAR